MNKTKAIAVFKSVIKASINKESGMKYATEYDYNGERWQICFDGFRLYIVSHTIPDEEFVALPGMVSRPFNLDSLKPVFENVMNHGKIATKEKISVADLRRGVKEAKACETYNRIIKVTPEISVVHYAHKEPFVRKPLYERVVFIINNNIAIPADHLIQALDLIKEAEVYTTGWNKPALIHSVKEKGYVLITPMGGQFWEEIKRGEITK